MSNYLLKLHVEKPGTPYMDPKTGIQSNSSQGHIWYEVVKPDGTSLAAGFATVDPKNTLLPVQGKVWQTDATAYDGDPYSTTTFNISTSNRGCNWSASTCNFNNANAASIAHQPTRTMNAIGQALTQAQPSSLDTNAKGPLSIAEAASKRLWADFHENGAIKDTDKVIRPKHSANTPTWEEAA
jgi:hypothetical protein